jgi:hypothetical protein
MAGALAFMLGRGLRGEDALREVPGGVGHGGLRAVRGGGGKRRAAPAIRVDGCRRSSEPARLAHTMPASRQPGSRADPVAGKGTSMPRASVPRSGTVNLNRRWLHQRDPNPWFSLERVATRSAAAPSTRTGPCPPPSARFVAPLASSRTRKAQRDVVVAPVGFDPRCGLKGLRPGGLRRGLAGWLPPRLSRA